MQEYIRAILALGAVSLPVSLLFPDGGKNKRAFTLALSVIALAVMARPLSVLSELSFSLALPERGEIGEIIADAEGNTLAAVEEAVGRGIALDIESRFALPAGSVEARASLDVTVEEMTVRELLLTLGREAVYADHMAIREYARKNYTQNCEVRVDG